MTTTHAQRAHDTTTTPVEQLLTGALLVGPLLLLAADSTYAARGFDDGTGGVLHVLGAIAYGLVVLRVVGWLPAASRLAGLLLLVGLAGLVGNAAYGFEAIHESFGDTPLVDRSGAATLIKPLGLLFPLSLALIALALRSLAHSWQAAVLVVVALVWPAAHIGDMAALAVAVNVALVLALGSLAWRGPVRVAT